MEQDQKYMELLQEIEGSKARQGHIVEGIETPGNMLGFRGLPQERYYQDLAGRFMNLRQDHMNRNYDFAEKFEGREEADNWLENFLKSYK